MSMDLGVDRLRVQSMHCPMGIDIEKYTFSWQLISDMENTIQTAYRIRVFGSKLVEDMVWDSGAMEGSKVWYTTDAPLPISNRSRYYFNIQVWDNHGNTAASDLSWFETGIGCQDWKGVWIEPDQRPTPKEDLDLSRKLTSAEDVEQDKGIFGTRELNRDYREFNPCQYLRRDFCLDQSIVKARMYITAHGLYRLYINGNRVGDREFAPEFTSYHNILMVQTYDVTRLLQQGENGLGIVLADGWWCGRIGGTGQGCQYGDRIGTLFQLEVQYSDGSVAVFASDEKVRSSGEGPLRYSDIFVGEHYDARMELGNFSSPGFIDTDWKPVKTVDYGYDNLVGHTGEPVRIIKEITPKGVLITPKGERVLDLGQVIAGRIRMKVSGPRGVKISLEHSEVLDEEGNFINNIEGRNKDQQDYYVLKGEGVEEYEPWFTFHGFRYVKIEGYPGALSVANFTGVALSSDLADIGGFLCSDDRINRLQQNIWWSQVANTLSIPTDCPQRERSGWTGDILIFAPTASYLRDMYAFLGRWMDNLRADQLPDGQVPNVVPYIKAYQELSAKMFNSESSSGWGDAVLAVPWALYNAYGDARVLAENYDAMKKWMQYVQHTAENEFVDGYEDFAPERREWQKYLWNTGFHFGDWLIPSMSIQEDGEASGMMRSAFLTKELVAPSFYAYNTDLMSRIASVLGREEEAAYYKDLNAKIRDAFAKEYLQADGRLAAHFQGIYVLALQMKLVPENMEAKVLDHLLQLIEKNDACLDTGFLSVPFLLDVLTRHGRKDVAYRLLYQTKCPSWLYEVEHGATTIWEAWQAIMPNGKVTNVSYNHYAFGAVGNWMYREIAGLKPLEPGYASVRICPGLDSGLSYAEASYLSPYGQYYVQWTQQRDRGSLHVVIPPCCTAEIILPSGQKKVGSGIYDFTL